MIKYILLGEPAFRVYSDELKSFGFSPIILPPDGRLNNIIAAHADTLIFECGGHMIINSVYLSQLELPETVLAHVEATDDFPSGLYPNDVRFNALALNGFLYAKKSSLSYSVVKYAEQNRIDIVDVAQGYAKCSVLTLPSSNRAVTADEGLARAMEAHGVRVLRISSGGIRLDGCGYGFIGGASFVDDPMCCCSLHSRPAVYFYGSLAAHPDGARIVQFCEDGGYEVVLLGGELTDFGGGVVV